MAERFTTPLSPDAIAQRIEQGLELRVTRFATGFNAAKFYYTNEAPGHWNVYRGNGRQQTAQGYVKITQTLADGRTEVELNATEPQAFGSFSIYFLVGILGVMVLVMFGQMQQTGGFESSPVMPLLFLAMLAAVGYYAYTFYAGQKALRAYMVQLLQVGNGNTSQ